MAIQRKIKLQEDITDLCIAGTRCFDTIYRVVRGWRTSFGPLHTDSLVDEEARVAPRASEICCTILRDDSVCDILARLTHILQEEVI